MSTQFSLTLEKKYPNPNNIVEATGITTKILGVKRQGKDKVIVVFDTQPTPDEIEKVKTFLFGNESPTRISSELTEQEKVYITGTSLKKVAI